MISIFILDDHRILRSALRVLLEQEANLTVVGEAGSIAEGLRALPDCGAQICLVDLTLPDGCGLDFVKKAKEQADGVRFLALTMHEEEKYLLPFLEAGGMGYLNKAMADQELLRAISQVMDGQAYLGERGVQLMAKKWMGESDRSEASVKEQALSAREKEVICLVARGLTSAEIGKRLYLSPRTIDTYRNRLMKKLGLHTRAELVDYVIRHQLLEG